MLKRELIMWLQNLKYVPFMFLCYMYGHWFYIRYVLHAQHTPLIWFWAHCSYEIRNGIEIKINKEWDERNKRFFLSCHEIFDWSPPSSPFIHGDPHPKRPTNSIHSNSVCNALTLSCLTEYETDYPFWSVRLGVAWHGLARL